MSHLYQFFFLLAKYNIVINFKKTYIDFSTVHFLDQRILFLKLFTAQEKINIITKLNFSKNFKNLETYLELIEWLWQYVSYYTHVAESLQQQKTILSRCMSFKEWSHICYTRTAELQTVTDKKKEVYDILQTQFARMLFLVHFDFTHVLYVNIDVFKKCDFSIVIFHVKEQWNNLKISSSKNLIESIMFFSRFLKKIERNYWLTKLEITCLVWIF